MSEDFDIQIRRAAASELIDLRHAVLRQGFPRSEAIFPGDDAPTSRHFAAAAGPRVVGCVTLHLNEWEGAPAWQLRGMAVDPEFQNRGIGSRLLTEVERSVLEDSPTRLLWCNGRVPALAFYERHGWAMASEQFEVPASGPHFKLIRRL